MAKQTKTLVVWTPPEPPPQEKRLAEVRDMELEARAKLAETRTLHLQMQDVGMRFVVSQLEKWLRMAEAPEFKDSVGPLDPKVVLKLAEFVSKNFRLDNGQATEHIATHVTKSVDFSKLSQEERNAWRALAVKAGADEEG